MSQKVVIPKGTINAGETAVIEIPNYLHGTSVVVAKNKNQESTIDSSFVGYGGYTGDSSGDTTGSCGLPGMTGDSANKMFALPNLPPPSNRYFGPETGESHLLDSAGYVRNKSYFGQSGTPSYLQTPSSSSSPSPSPSPPRPAPGPAPRQYLQPQQRAAPVRDIPSFARRVLARQRNRTLLDPFACLGPAVDRSFHASQVPDRMKSWLDSSQDSPQAACRRNELGELDYEEFKDTDGAVSTPLGHQPGFDVDAYLNFLPSPRKYSPSQPDPSFIKTPPSRTYWKPEVHGQPSYGQREVKLHFDESPVKEKMKHLDQMEFVEQEQLMDDLRNYQKARRRLVYDVSNMTINESDT